MDNVRLILWFALLGSLWLSYTAWVEDYAPAPAPTPDVSTPAVETTEPGTDLPALDRSPGDKADTVPPLQTATASADTAAAPATIDVRTDVLDLEISLRGGDLVRADLLDYPVDKANPDDLVRLLDYRPDDKWVFQTGLRYTDDGPEANHLAPFRASQSSYTLAEGADELEVRLDWAGSDDLAVSKVYRFHRGAYEIFLDIDIDNKGNEPWQGTAYTRMVRLHKPPSRRYMHVDTYSFTGPVLYDGDQYDTLDFDEIAEQPIDQTVRNGWLAGIQHHFIAGAVPPGDEETRFIARTMGRDYILTAQSPIKTVAPGAMLTYPVRFFVGPKLQDQLAATAPDFEKTVDYGLLTPISRPLFIVLDWVHGWVHNWGLAIVLVTIMIKLLFYKLTAMSGRSMAKMRKLQPRMKALQERYKDDRQALSRAMMDLYKREKVNPAAGCLPVLIQMPFFFAFYWVLVESVEMRQAPFMLWINDLSVRDPYFVLPLLMGAAMLLQMRIQPAPPDPVQAKVMQIMPIAFTAMFAFFPAGLVLYWLTNTVMSMAQQWRINQLVAKET